MIKVSGWLACLTALASAGVSAQGPDYRCTIERVESVAAPQVLESWRKRYAGKEFTVHRRTGVMAGALNNAYLTAPAVVDAGSSENSFKAVTVLRKEQGARPWFERLCAGRQ